MFRIEGNLEEIYQLSDPIVPRGDCGTLIDNYDSQDFNLNDAGWIRNDISALARAQSKAEFDMIMSRLQVLPDKPGIGDDVSIEDAFKQIRPRWCQSPNELELWAQMTNGDAMDKLDAAYREAMKDVKVDNNDTTESPSQSAD